MTHVRHCTIVWSVLLVLTILSGFLAEGTLYSLSVSDRTVAITLLVIAFYKVRLVVIHFMEVGQTVAPLRMVLEFWMLALFAMLIFMYLMAPVVTK